MLLFSLFRVSGHSMEPTFRQGQTLLVSSIPYLFTQPKVGDVVVIKDPRNGKSLLKRITKIEPNRHSGDSERSVEDSRIRFWTSQNDGREMKYFVSGDNIKDSRDSRVFGAISNRMIIGKVIYG